MGAVLTATRDQRRRKREREKARAAVAAVTAPRAVLTLGDAIARQTLAALLRDGEAMRLVVSPDRIPGDVVVVSNLDGGGLTRGVARAAEDRHVADFIERMAPIEVTTREPVPFIDTPAALKVDDDSPRNRAERRALAKRMRRGAP